jgi:hypothetical protein
VVLIREGSGQLSSQLRVCEDPCRGTPFDDDPVQIGVHIQLCGVASCTDEVDDELAYFLGRQMPGPREDLRQSQQDCSRAFVAADQCREEAGGDLGSFLALTVVTFCSQVEVFAIASRYVDALSTLNGVGDAFGVLR